MYPFRVQPSLRSAYRAGYIGEMISEVVPHGVGQLVCAELRLFGVLGSSPRALVDGIMLVSERLARQPRGPMLGTRRDHIGDGREVEAVLSVEFTWRTWCSRASGSGA